MSIKEDIILRTIEARQLAFPDEIDLATGKKKKFGGPQSKMAKALGIDPKKYQKYEHISSKRTTALPIEYWEKFCDITGIRMEWYLTGRGPMQLNGEARKLVDKIINLNERHVKQISKLYEITSDSTNEH